jgi:hypothetical protein
MTIVMQRTLEYIIQLTKTPGTDPKLTESIVELWNNIGPDNKRETNDGIRYVKIETK